MNYIVLGLSKYNILIQFTSSQCHEDECVNNEEGIQFLQNCMDEDVQSYTVQDNSRPDITILESNKNQTIYSFIFFILGQVSMIEWLGTVQSDSSTGGAYSSSAMDILIKREKIRCVFQHYPFYFIDVSYILSSLLC